MEVFSILFTFDGRFRFAPKFPEDNFLVDSSLKSGDDDRAKFSFGRDEGSRFLDKV